MRDKNLKDYPILIEYKGSKNALVKLSNGQVENVTKKNEPHFSNIKKYAVNGAVHYQEKPYFTGDKIKILKSKDDRFNKLNGLFFISTMTKSFSSFSWGGSSFNVKIIGDQLMKLPTENQQPNYKIMETLISAIQKQIIKDVVLYFDNKIGA